MERRVRVFVGEKQVNPEKLVFCNIAVNRIVAEIREETAVKAACKSEAA